jgi:hypothetical protein
VATAVRLHAVREQRLIGLTLRDGTRRTSPIWSFDPAVRHVSSIYPVVVPDITARRARRNRHGRPLRAADGAFPGAAVPRQRLEAEVDSATEWLTTHNPTLPALTVELREVPPPRVVDRTSAAAVAAGALLGAVESAPGSGLTVVLHVRPLLLWADDAAALRTLVRQALVAQVAEATGLDPDELYPDGR